MRVRVDNVTHLSSIFLANSNAFACLSLKEISSSPSNGGTSPSIRLERAELMRCSRSSAIATLLNSTSQINTWSRYQYQLL
jgi:hypothetical protein